MKTNPQKTLKKNPKTKKQNKKKKPKKQKPKWSFMTVDRELAANSNNLIDIQWGKQGHIYKCMLIKNWRQTGTVIKQRYQWFNNRMKAGE